MTISPIARRMAAKTACLMLAAVTGACTLSKQSAPDVAGPSEFATSITMTAAPHVLPRDGVSSSTITLHARDENGQALASRRVRLQLSQANAGTLSVGEVTTDATGTATFRYTAPGVSESVNEATIEARLVETGDFGNSTPRVVTIGLSGAAIPVPSFAISPQSPARFQPTTFDASATTLEGAPCGSRCTYSWSFGNEGTATGQVVSYQFQNDGAYAVTLVVTTSDGASVTATPRIVTVTPASAPTAVITAVPTTVAPGDTVFFNSNQSTPAQGGGSIVSYLWTSSHTGETKTGATAQYTYPSAGTFVVTLTITDSNGLSDSAAQVITVEVP